MKNELEKIKTLLTNEFTDGVRILLLLTRGKEKGNKNLTYKKVITTNSEEFYEKLEELIKLKNDSELPFRIYSSVNSRSLEKAIREFKHRQLEADYYDIDSKLSFYYDVKNRFISSLMKPSCRAQNYFLLDIDKHIKEDSIKRLEEIDARTIMTYKTKNGWHIITTPFNPALVSDLEDVTVNKDGLILLSY